MHSRPVHGPFPEVFLGLDRWCKLPSSGGPGRLTFGRHPSFLISRCSSTGLLYSAGSIRHLYLPDHADRPPWTSPRSRQSWHGRVNAVAGREPPPVFSGDSVGSPAAAARTVLPPLYPTLHKNSRASRNPDWGGFALGVSRVGRPRGPRSSGRTLPNFRRSTFYGSIDRPRRGIPEVSGANQAVLRSHERKCATRRPRPRTNW